VRTMDVVVVEEAPLSGELALLEELPLADE
jgi:hypothetical protein